MLTTQSTCRLSARLCAIGLALQEWLLACLRQLCHTLVPAAARDGAGISAVAAPFAAELLAALAAAGPSWAVLPDLRDAWCGALQQLAASCSEADQRGVW